MAGETFYDGDLLILSVYSGSAWKTMGCLTSNGFTQSWDLKEVTRNKCDGENNSVRKGSRTAELSFSLLFVDESVATNLASYETLDTLANGAEDVFWRLDSTIAGWDTRYGTGIFTQLALDANAGDEISASGNVRITSETSTDPKA